MGISTVYPDFMARRGKAERPLIDFLRYASLYRHYAYLRNGPFFVSLQTGIARALMPTGTAASRKPRIPFPYAIQYIYVYRLFYVLLIER